MFASRSIMVVTRPKRFSAAGVQIPHRIGHRLVVRVDEIVAVILVAGEMNLLHALRRHARSGYACGSNS